MTFAPADRASSTTVPLAEASDLLVHAATLLFVNGQTTQRTARLIEALGVVFGLRAEPLLQWDALRLEISNRDQSLSRVRLVEPLGVHMGRVAATMRVIEEAEDGLIDPPSIRSRLAAVDKIQLASFARFVLMAAAGAAGLGVIFGAARPLTVLLIAFSAGAGAALRRGLAKFSDNVFAQPFCAALLAGLIGAVAIHLRLDVLQRLVIFCPCMVLVPGPHFLNGAIDLLRARMSLGASRVLYAGLTVVAISAGLLVGLALAGASLPPAQPGAPVPLLYDIAAAGVAVAAYGTFFSMEWRLLPAPMAIGMAAHAARWLAIAAGCSVAIGALVACLIVGAIVTPVAHRLRLPFAALGFASVVSLIPGVFLFQVAGGLVDLVAQGPQAPGSVLADVVANGFSAFMILLAITIGLILPKMLIEKFAPQMT
jgi:uncharacterized membrane protein YjjP (DUF1212 family)